MRTRERCASRQRILTVDADDFSHLVFCLSSRMLKVSGRDHSKICLCKVVKVVCEVDSGERKHRGFD